MNKNNDYLSPDTSPQQLQTSGVKRVNNMPLFIAIGILTIFVVLIALVAQKRAHAQNQAFEPVKLNSSKKNTLRLANDVVGQYQSGMIMPPAKTMEKVKAPSMPLPKEQNQPSIQAMPIQDISDSDIERIRQEKALAFEEAVKAKTTVMVDEAQLHHNDSQNNQDSPVNIDVANTFKAHLQKLQGIQNARPTPQILGGQENETRWHLNSSLENPNTRYELRAGGVIPGVMVSKISSELPGQIIGQVSQNVYDTATGRHLLIPQGTKLIGVYSNEIGFGQNSVLVAWQRLVYPDGKALDIGSMPGADSAGMAGFRDQVDHHYARVYGSALLMSAIIGGITYSQSLNQNSQLGYNQPTAGNVLSQALGQQLGEVTSQLVSKNLNVSPTVNVSPGYRFNVIVVKDLIFKSPYKQFAY